jgi:hypothetical protein
MRTIRFSVLAAAVIGAIAPAAHAHTNVILTPGQMIGGGYVHVAGLAPAVQQPDQPNGPATDGTLVVHNLDPLVTGLSIRCVAGDCLAEGTAARSVSLAPGTTEVELPKRNALHPRGTYRVETRGENALASFGVFRVTSG